MEAIIPSLDFKSKKTLSSFSISQYSVETCELKQSNSWLEKYLNKNTFPYGEKINFNSIRKNEIIGEHEVKFSSGKEIITLNHEAFDRALYSEGALSAAKWLMTKKPGLYSMRDLMNFK